MNSFILKYNKKLTLLVLSLCIIGASFNVSQVDSASESTTASVKMSEAKGWKGKAINKVLDDRKGTGDCVPENASRGEDGHCHCNKGYVAEDENGDGRKTCRYAPCEEIEGEVEELTAALEGLQSELPKAQARLQSSRALLQKLTMEYSNGTSTRNATTTKR